MSQNNCTPPSDRENIADILGELVAAGMARCDVADVARRLGRWVGTAPVGHDDGGSSSSSSSSSWDCNDTLPLGSAWQTLGQVQWELNEAATDLDLLPHAPCDAATAGEALMA